ncbi:ankyrin repeat-containing domain protein [Morchella snyderi]|nr:ankyrin repeat-containing domain protein [Morchella snyderi]
MSLLQLSNELLLIISRDLESDDLNSFLQTNRRLANLLTPLLHKIAIEDRDLSCAIRGGYAPLVKLLLENGKGGTSFLIGSAIHWAAFYGRRAVIEQLLDMGVDISQKDISGESALFWAVRSGREAIVSFLLERGADINEKGRLGSNLLQVATNSGFEELARLLIARGADIKDLYKDERPQVLEATGMIGTC